jgi:hypothetical protein
MTTYGIELFLGVTHFRSQNLHRNASLQKLDLAHLLWLENFNRSGAIKNFDKLPTRLQVENTTASFSIEIFLL